MDNLPPNSLGFQGPEPESTEQDSILEMRLTVSRKHQRSLIGPRSPPALCFVMQDFLFSFFQWSATRLGSVLAAPSRQNKVHLLHNAALLVSRLEEARKWGRCVAATHALSARSQARSMATM